MPRVSGVYSRPAGIDAVSGAVIESADYNLNVADVEADLNFPRPIVAGGTGATTVVGARQSLGVEAAAQTVANYDTFVFENGSFWSASGATGAPTPTGIYSGNAVIINNDPNYINLVARDLTGSAWTRQKSAGTWGAWSGDLNINKATPGIVLNKPASGTSTFIAGKTNGLTRWVMQIGSEHAEAGGNAGSNFALNRYNDAGTLINAPLSVDRGTGDITLTGNVRATAGRVLINGSALPGQVAVLYDSSLRSCVSLQAVGAATGGELIAFMSSGGALSGSITYGAGQTSVAYNTASDERLKTDLQPFDAGPILDAMRVYDFAWIATGDRAHGVIAQEVDEVYPAAVTHSDSSDTWGVDYSRFVPLLLNEIKSLRARVAALEAII